MLFLITLQAAPPTYTSEVTVNGQAYCYNYYFASQSNIPSTVEQEMAVANYSCITAFLLSVDQLLNTKITVMLADQFAKYALVGQTTTGFFKGLNLMVQPKDMNNASFSAFQFYLVVGGQMLTVDESILRMGAQGKLHAAGPAGLFAFMIKNSTLVDFADLSEFMNNVRGPYASYMRVIFQSANSEYRNNLAAFQLECTLGLGTYTCSSCGTGKRFDSYTQKCISEVSDNMDCSECALGFMHGRVNSGKDETKGCFERAYPSNDGQKDCYYTTYGSASYKNCVRS